jgi:cholesterol oxidase
VQTDQVHVTGARRVVLAAGTLGTNELLLRSRDELGWLPNISRTLGQGFSANGDFLGSIHHTDSDLNPHRGPDVTSTMSFGGESHEFVIAAPTFNESVMRVLASTGQPSGRALRPLSPLLWRLLPAALPWAFKHGLLSRPSPLPARNGGDWQRSTTLFGIGRDNANGQVVLSGNGIDLKWEYAAENAALIGRITVAMTEIADCYGGTFSPLLTWNIFRKIITVHPLGGCRLSETPAGGVVSQRGEVHDYPGLFVSDGSVVPTSIGFHPVMTIAALAERSAEAVCA